MQKSTSQKTAIYLRNPFDGLSDEVSKNTGLECLDPTLAQQNFADECDINTIVNNFIRSGELPDESSKPSFGDFSRSIDNFHDAMNLIADANAAFYDLPANIRSRFDNNPAKYVDFFENPRNQAEAIELGLASPRQDSSDNDESNTSVADESSKLKTTSSKGGKKASQEASEGD